MAGALIGALRVSLSLDTAAFEKGASQAQRQAAALGKKMQGMGDRLTGIGAKLSLGITAPFAALVAKAIPAAVQSQQAIGQVNAALASMGPVAGRTSDQLKKFAGDLQHISTFDDDDILRKVTANLLTFGNVSGTAFDRAQTAAVNLSARLGQDLQASAIQVGKALNDPIKGMTALGRVGVQFSEDQKKAIKAMVDTGNVAGAQNIILGELERQFGGAAKAMRDATPGAAMAEQWRTLQENIGAIALKILPPLIDLLTRVANAFNQLSPGMQTAIVAVLAFSAAIGPVVTAIGGLITLTGVLVPAFAGMTTGIVAAAAASGGFIPLLVGMVPALAAIAAVVGTVYLAWKNWDKIVAVISAVWQKLTAAAAGINAAVQSIVTTVTGAWNRIVASTNAMVARVVDRLTGGLSSAWNTVKQKAKEAGDAFYRLWDRVVGHSYVPDMVDGIRAEMARLDAVLVQPAQDATSKAAEAFRSLQERLSSLLAKLYPEQAQQNQFLNDLATLQQAAKAGTISVDQLNDAIGRLKANSGDGISGVMSSLPQVAPADVGGNPTGPTFDSSQSLSLTPETLSAVNDQWDRMNTALADVTAQAPSVADGFSNIGAHLVDDLSSGLTNVIMGTEKLGDMFRHVLADIAAEIIKSAIKKLLTNLLMSAGMGFSGGGPVPGFATGGRISGSGTGTSDSIPAMLSNGEFVVNARAAGQFMPLLQAINSGKFPRLAMGGPVMNHRLPANDVGRIGGGGTIFNVTVAGAMNDRDARRTGMQVATSARAEIARSSQRGF